MSHSASRNRWTSPFTRPASQFCLPGQTLCQSYNNDAWAGTSPIVIKSVTFANGSQARQWAAVSDYGGKAEINQYCGAANYGTPYCIYPWYSLGTTGYDRSGRTRPTATQSSSRDDRWQTGVHRRALSSGYDVRLVFR